MHKFTTIAGLALAWSLALAAPVHATTLIVPGEAATAESSYNANTPFGNGSSSGFIHQIAYATSQFAGIAAGTAITGIGFRIYSDYESNDQDLEYTAFDIQVGHSANGIGQLVRTFNANLGGDTVTARSGALSIAAGTFIGDQLINPFYTINFTTPYIYQGGDLLVTIRSSLAAGTEGAFVPLDAVENSATLGSVAISSTSATKGAVNFFYVPVTQLTFASAAVPEPATWMMMVAGFGLVGGLRRRSLRTAAA